MIPIERRSIHWSPPSDTMFEHSLTCNRIKKILRIKPKLVKNKVVADFGCAQGYGSSFLIK